MPKVPERPLSLGEKLELKRRNQKDFKPTPEYRFNKPGRAKPKKQSPPATPSQLVFITKLMSKSKMDHQIPELTRFEASSLIDKLLGKSKKQATKERRDFKWDLENQVKLFDEIREHL